MINAFELTREVKQLISFARNRNIVVLHDPTIEAGGTFLSV